MRVGLVRILFGAVLSLWVVIASGCGGGSETQPSSLSTSASFSSGFVFIGDAPPPGSTILKFEITLTGAVLCPQVSGGQCQGSPQPSLISQPVEIELKQLELESAFLNLASIQPGTFQGAKLTFANPELVVLFPDNPTPLKLTPPLTVSMVTPTFDGGLTVAANTDFGFLVDFNIFDSIQSSGNTITGITPVVTLVKLPAVASGKIDELDDVVGTVTGLNKACPNGTFTLIQSTTGIPIPNIRFDASTEFDDDDDGDDDDDDDDDDNDGVTCATLANNQVVEADLELRAMADLQSAEFFAEEIELALADDDDDELEGVVFQVNSESQFVLFVMETEGVPNVAAGSFVTINLDGNTQFKIDDDALSVSSSEFDTGADVLVGQGVEVESNGTLVVNGSCTLGDNCTATAEELELEDTRVTGRVASLSGSTFTLDQLPSLFGNSGMTRPISADCQSCFVGSILVATSSQTEFDDLPGGVASLTVGDIVRVRGLLLKNTFTGPAPGTGTPRLEAMRVRKNDDD